MKLSAILPVSRGRQICACCCVLLFLTSLQAQATPATACEPAPAIRAELETASAAASGRDFDRNVAPFLALRARHPNDLVVHERYQDAVQRHGIEGHLRKLTEDYQVLSLQHPDELMYSYLYAHSLIGRNTASAIEQMMEIVADHPEFAPAHRALAEIYFSAPFHDQEKQKTELAHFLALCPGSALQLRPLALPDPSPLVDQAERLLAENGDPDRIVAMAQQGIRDDEWRLQRIRPFDWYSVDYKRQSQHELQTKYWKFWSFQVRCERRAGRPEQASQLLALLEQRAAMLQNDSGPAYWDALAILVRLYEEGNQKQSAAEKLDAMQQFLTRHPDPQRTAQLEDLRRLIGAGDK
ncbi:MAG: hypothetical protein WB755_17675 [Terriglobales bacterium]